MDSQEKSKQEALNKLMLTTLNVKELFQGIRNNNKVALGKAITLIESKLPEHRKLANELITLCLPFTGQSLRIGITGVPGVGKSTFINIYTQLLLKEGNKIAILAVDPTSQHTGGSILGDKTRMEDIYAHPNVLIRPSPAGETLGGVTGKTRESILLCEAAGYDRILVETVGVGQSETVVHSMTDIFLLLMLPGAGDELQGIKRGIMEMADIIVVHKADGGNEGKAKIALADYQRALHLFPPTESEWTPRVITASSTAIFGIDHIHQAIEAYTLHCTANGYIQHQRVAQRKEWFRSALEMLMLEYLQTNDQVRHLYEQKELEVAEGKATPYPAAEAILQNFLR